MDLPQQFSVYKGKQGVINRLPVKLSKKIELANWAAGLFEVGRVYSEGEVNELIGKHIEDFALIRRMLVTSGQLVRDDYGREYRRVLDSKTQAN